ncbi:SusC/RagA family TonB-linked outer membrane protein [Flavitalea sp. BT771]|uniref:SusC/RagA family TonB-linked outer membrane protein n=1 Tax=Flavitalea sp. BT771 TaxID=3063329 RepID=UPI0026E2AF96|nr:SusC/RagA family TonB-linked outer membrane protein [Flavitalea sp. BT771]MDO6430711.1 SusC/RagA family TonB-linked outer membrane protein [Flavitalea sp. BT771]MDV6219149.1 SusC/RagA family TonB-linked outer membrane protein [Flavitalea sp. BT771]
MQASAVLLFAFCLQVSAATYSQTVSFTGKDVPLKTVFASVKKQTGFGFFYENGEEATLKGAGNVTVDLKNVALDLFLQVCLRDKPLEYTLEGTTVFIKKKEVRSSVTVESSDSSRIPEIKGRVTNDKGEPLVNANVVVKRTGRGTVTDANGRFTLHNVGADDVITVSFIGYKAQAVPVRDRSSFTLVMEPATNELDKMVVQAYGTTSQRLATGNIGVVRAEEIAKQPVMNVMNALQGQVAGTVVTNTSGYASGAVKIEIRGRNTINPNFPSDPLYIIDGVPLTILDLAGGSSYAGGSQGLIQSGLSSPANGQSPFFSLNPSDIESISVLKDADATAIYGSRGANGVILITTKKGKAGKSHIDINLYSGYSQITKYYHLLNTPQYLKMREEALKNDAIPIDVNSAPDLTVWDTTRYTDWQKYAFGHTGKATAIDVSLSGGDNRTTFRIGAGYNRLTEILTAAGDNKRASLSVGIDHKSTNQKLVISLSGTYSVSSSDMVYTPQVLTLPPNTPPVFTSQHKINYSAWTPLNDKAALFQALIQPYNFNTNFLNSSILISYEIIPGLVIKSNLGYDYAQTNQSYLVPIQGQDPSLNPTGTSSFGSTNTHNTIIEPQIEYTSFIGKGRLNLMVGASEQDNKTSTIFLSGSGYVDDALLSSVQNAPVKYATNGVGEYKYEALFSRLNYNWENKYIMTLNARRDGSTKFGPGRQFGNFGSIGMAWIFTEEGWFKKNVPILSFGKLRASYGSTGGDQIRDYSFLSLWEFYRYTYNSILPLTPTSHTDSTLHWQVNKKLESAIELGFLKDRFNLQVTWYRNRCNDQLVQFPTPAFTGFFSVTSNSPANVENYGWEVNLTGKIIGAPHLSWNTKFNIGINRNKLLSYPNLSQSPYQDLYKIGQPLSISKYLHVTGVDPQTGQYTFQDKNKDGQITIDQSNLTSDDRYTYNMAPIYEGGFTNEISYKNWNISVFFYFKKQRAGSFLLGTNPAGDNTNQPTYVMNRWKYPGDVTNVSRFTTMPLTSDGFFTQSDAMISDASFVRLQNLSLSYTISQDKLRKIGIQNCRLYVQGNNLFFISSYKGLDPEVNAFGSLPKARILTAGLSLNL